MVERSGHGGSRNLSRHAEAWEDSGIPTCGDAVEEEVITDPVALDHAPEDAGSVAEHPRGVGCIAVIRVALAHGVAPLLDPYMLCFCCK